MCNTLHVNILSIYAKWFHTIWLQTVGEKKKCVATYSLSYILTLTQQNHQKNE